MRMPSPLTGALTLASPGGRGAGLSILIYHRALPEPDPLRPGDPDSAAFRWQMALLARHFNVLPLREAALRLRDGTLPPRAACVTFDDGYADNFTIALPILSETGVPATFFIATGYLDGGRMFNDTLIELARRMPPGTHDLSGEGLGIERVTTLEDRRVLAGKLLAHFKYQDADERLPAAEGLAERFGVELPDDLMMTTDQLRRLHAAGMEIGGHTHTHPILARLDAGRARHEIMLGKQQLEDRLDTPIRVFAYPNGRPGKDYRVEHRAMVEECGFDVAVSTRPASARAGVDLHELPRFTPWDRTPSRFGLRLLHSLATSR